VPNRTRLLDAGIRPLAHHATSRDGRRLSETIRSRPTPIRSDSTPD